MTGSPAGEGIACPVCGAENPAGSRFCERCGTRLPQRPREAAIEATSVEIAPPVARDDATITFQQLPSTPPEAEPPREETAPAQEREFEPTLIGTPPLGDYQVPARMTDEPQERAAESPATDLPAATEAPAAAESSPESLRDRPTMTFDLPDLSSPQRTDEARNAPTMAFELPKFDQPPASESNAAAADEAPAAASAPSSQTGEGDANASGWSYQSWRPDPAAQQPTAASDEPRLSDSVSQTPLVSEEPPAVSAPPPVTPPPLPQATDAGAPPPFPSAQGNTGTSPWPSAATPPAATPPAFPSTPPPSSSYPSSTYPSVSAGQTAAPPAYSQPPAVTPQGGGYSPAATGAQASAIPAYPTSGEQRNNRALWIILGVIGAIFVLCILACALLFVLGAVDRKSVV